MGRPLSKQQLFGANTKNNIKVQFNNGTASVDGYIIRQTGSKRFVCSDINGVQKTCYLKAKASASLAAGEMSITVLDDTNTAYQITKIARHRVSYSNTSAPWTFTADLTDGYVQMEEAGINTSMTGAIDLEGDDVNKNYPIPGSGSYQTAAAAFTGMSYSLKGTAAAVTGGIATVPNGANGLFRSKYAGHFNDSLGGLPANWNMSFFTTTPVTGTVVDTYVSWGNQIDTVQQQNFSCEFKGYVKVPVTGTYNFYSEVDDDCAVWIGNNALDANISNSNYDMQGSNKSMPGSTIVNANSRTMTAGTWYPIRIWTTEYTGGTKFQIYAISTANVKYNGQTLAWSYNTATNGY